MVDRVYPRPEPDEPDEPRRGERSWPDALAPFVGDRGEEGLQTPSVSDLQQQPPVNRECLRIRVLLRDHADGDLPQTLRREVEDHVHECADCDRALSRAEYEVLRLRRVIEGQLPQRALTPPADFTANVLQRVRESEFDSVQLAIDQSAPANFTPRVMERVRKEWEKPRGLWGLGVGRRRHWLASMLTAAMLSIAVGAGWHFLTSAAPPSLHVTNPVDVWVTAAGDSAERQVRDGDPLAIGEQLRVGADGSVTLVLGHGSNGPALEEFVLASGTLVSVRGPELIELRQGDLTVHSRSGVAVDLRRGAALEFDAGVYAVSVAPVERVDGQLWPRVFMRTRVEVEDGVAWIQRGSLGRVEVRPGEVAEFDDWSPVRVDRAFDAQMLKQLETTAVAERRDEPRSTYPPGSLVGTVLDAASGAPVVGASVEVRTALGPQVLTTNQDGHYELRGLEDHVGAHARVEVTPVARDEDGRGWAPYGPAILRLQARIGNDGVRYLPDIRLDRDRRVAGTVVDPLLKPLAGASISVCIVDELRGAMRRLKGDRVFSGPDGSFELGLPWQVAPHEALAVLIEHAKFPVTASLALMNGRDYTGKPLELRVAAPHSAMLSGLPADTAVEVLEGVAGLPAGTVLRRHSGRSDATGRLQLLGVGSGPFWCRGGSGALAVSLDDGPETMVAAALPQLPEADPEVSTWLPFGRDRYDMLAPATQAGAGAQGTPARRDYLTVKADGLARPGTQLFRVVGADRALEYLGEYEGGPVAVESSEGESFEILGIAPDGAIGVLPFDGTTVNSSHTLEVFPPGGAQLEVALRPQAADEGKLSILRFEMVAGPLRGMVLYREVTREDAWSVDGLVPGFYRVSFAVDGRITEAICRVVSGQICDIVAPR